jgi:hypothetical protein
MVVSGLNGFVGGAFLRLYDRWCSDQEPERRYYRPGQQLHSKLLSDKKGPLASPYVVSAYAPNWGQVMF